MERLHLTDIEIPSTVTNIEGNAFAGCSSLIDIIIPAGLTSMGYGAFSGCSSLTSIEMPSGVTSISNRAFYDCSNLVSVTISKGVTEIGNESFASCYSLKNVDIPSGVLSIGESAFFNATSLENVTMPESLTNIGAEAFRGCSSLRSVTIPSGVTTIQNGTFLFCSSLKNITIPESVTSIEENAFSKYSDIRFFGKEGSYIETYANDNNMKFNIYIVTFDANGGTNLSKTSEEIKLNAKIGELPIVERDGYTLKGWYTQANGGTKITENTVITADTTYYAQWEGIIPIENATVTVYASDLVYDGREKHPIVIVELNGKQLQLETDYTLIYANNVSAGEATVSITGKGNYAGIITKTFTIAAKPILSTDVTISTESYTYTGTENIPAVTVKSGNKTLVLGTDYILTYENNISVGTATVTITGKNNYTGTVTKKFTITPMSIKLATITLSEESFVYDRTKKQPSITINIGDKVLESGKDYTIDYENNLNVGTAYVCVTGKGNYSETVKMPFKIVPSDVGGITIKLLYDNCVYDESEKRPSVILMKGDKVIASGDYSVEYANNIDVGTATVTIKFGKNYTGTLSTTFEITPADITKAEVTLSQESFNYDGIAKQPYVILKIGSKQLSLGRDYTVSYKNNADVGVATAVITGIGNYTGAINKTFIIIPVSVTGMTVSLSQDYFTYDGKEKKPDVTVEWYGKVLSLDKDYTLSYANNVEVGTATVTVTGKGHYSGSIIKKFTIGAKSIDKAEVSLSATSFMFDGTEKQPVVTVNVEGQKLVKDKDYTVTYNNNQNIGTATVTITGKGNYTGTLTKTFIIKEKIGATFESGNYKYKVTSSSAVAFCGFAAKKTATTVTILPSVKYGGKTFKVTSIADKALKGKTKVTKVTVGDNVTSIGTSAFAGCTKLSKITIGKRVKTIGTSAFEGCKKLSSVTLGAAVTTIGSKAFKGCVALKNITIPSKVTKLDKQAFYGCKKLKTITIKSTKLKTVGKDALKGINSKATIKVPKSKLSAYKKLLKGKGQGSKVKIVKY